MSALSIILPDEMAKASRVAAKKLGVSRTQFIRLAITHELEHFETQREQAAILKSITAMKKSTRYLKESENIIENFSSELPKDEDEWWK